MAAQSGLEPSPAMVPNFSLPCLSHKNLNENTFSNNWMPVLVSCFKSPKFSGEWRSGRHQYLRRKSCQVQSSRLVFIKADPIGFMNPGKVRKTISASGNCHLNIMIADTLTQHREYWLTKMLCSLEPGKKYRISLKLSSPKADPDLDNFGIWFTDQMIYASRDTLLQPEEFIGFADAKTKPLDNGWILITKEIIAQKPASILVLGNFSKTNNKDILISRNRKNTKPLFTFVDDISIVAAKRPPCIIDPAIRDTLYAERRRHTKIIPPRPPFYFRHRSILNQPPVYPIKKLPTDPMVSAFLVFNLPLIIMRLPIMPS